MANAKSHSGSPSNRQETSVGILTILEEKMEVYRVQSEIYSILSSHVNDSPTVEQKIRVLSKQLMTMTEVSSQNISSASPRAT